MSSRKSKPGQEKTASWSLTQLSDVSTSKGPLKKEAPAGCHYQFFASQVFDYKLIPMGLRHLAKAVGLFFFLFDSFLSFKCVPNRLLD